jgi:hypothetical protein
MVPVYFSYFPGAAGKTLINCLHLSEGVLFNEPFVENYNQRLSRILATVPDIDHTRFWSAFEIHNLIKGCDSYEPGNITDYNHALDQTNEFLPLVTHFNYNLACYEQQLGKGIRIKLNPDLKFIDTAIRIKWIRTTQALEPCLDLSALAHWTQGLEDFDFDICIENFDPLNQTKFDDDLNSILDYLKLKPNRPAIDQYLKKYRDYHFYKIKQMNLQSYYHER